MAVAPSLPPEMLSSGPRLATRAEAGSSSPAEFRLPRFFLNKIPIDRVSLDDAAEWALDAIKTRMLGRPLLIMGPNAQLVTLAARQPKFAEALQSADLCVPDGISIVLAARLLGQPVPERVPGGYERLKEHTRGRAIDERALAELIDSLPLASEEKRRLKALRPLDYTGLAARLAREI